MIPAALFQKNKKEFKKQTSSADEDDTPMHRKNLKFNNLNLIDFNAIADEGDAIIEDSSNRDRKQSQFARMSSLEILHQEQNNSIQEENDSENSNNAELNRRPSSPAKSPQKSPGKNHSLKVPQGNPNVRRLSKVQEDEDNPLQLQGSKYQDKQGSQNLVETDKSKEEPQAEPMGEYNSPHFPKLTAGTQQRESLIQNEKLQIEKQQQQPQSDSESDFDIFNPDDKESQAGKEVKESNIEIDEKLSKLTQEASALDRLLPKFIINPYGKFKAYWSGLMIIMLVYMQGNSINNSVLVLPVRLAFEKNPNEYIALDLTIDSIFFLDMAFTFFTAFEDDRGIVIIELNKIALNYLKGWFFIDLVATFPLYLILSPEALPGASSVNSLLRLARLPRIYKLAAVLRVGNLIKHQAVQKLFFFLKLNKEYTLILRFIIITFIVIHLAGCLWYFVGSISDEEKNWIMEYELAFATGFEQYIASVYFVLTILVTVGYGNILPVNNVEYIFAIIFQFLGVAFFAYVMGTLTFTFAKLSQKITMIKEREIFFNELAHTYSLPRETHERLLMSVENSIFSHSNQMLEVYNEEEFIQQLPPIVQGMICEYLFKDIIEKIRFLNGKPRGFLRRIFRYMIPTFLNKGDAIFFRGEPADFVYFVIRGRLVTKCEDQRGKVRTLVHVEGSYFGEVDIMVSRARGESAIAETQAEVWKISKDHLMRILNDFEDVKMEMLEYAIKKEKSRKSTIKAVKNKQFLELLAMSKKDRIIILKSQFVTKVKEKVIVQLQEIVKGKTEQNKELFKDTHDLDSFLDKVQEYNKICSKLNITEEDLAKTQQLKPTHFTDPEIEESLLKGYKVQTHLNSIQEYL